MNDKKLTQADIDKTFSISKIWIIPILTLVLGIWMVYQHMQQRGTLIEVYFETAEGLIPNKTKLKHRDVDIGIIKKIYFSADGKSIITQIKVDAGLDDWLREDTQFWVVKPRIGNQGVSGISTLLSGAYIELSPGESSHSSRHFVGLEKPPLTEKDQQGLRLSLVSTSDRALSPGEPVIYRGFTVGLVESSQFDPATRAANYSVFVRAPYDALVTSNTYFWDVSGFSVETNAKGLKLNLESMESLVTGGVTFDVPKDLELGERVTQHRIFKLYDNEEAVYENREYDFKEYVLLVEDSVGGLYAGAPVEYRGIRLGTVSEPYITFSHAADDNVDDSRIAVVIRIEPGRIYGDLPGFSLAAFEKTFREQIKNGLVGSIESGSLLFGGLLVSLDFSGEQRDNIEQFGPYTVIPSKPGGLNKFTEKLDRLFTKIDELPLLESVNSLNKLLLNGDKALQTLQQAIINLEDILNSEQIKDLPEDLQRNLRQLEATLNGLSPESTAYQELEKTLLDIQQLFNDLHPLVNTLNNKPNALIFGMPPQVDQEPGEKLNE